MFWKLQAVHYSGFTRMVLQLILKDVYKNEHKKHGYYHEHGNHKLFFNHSLIMARNLLLFLMISINVLFVMYNVGKWVSMGSRD